MGVRVAVGLGVGVWVAVGVGEGLAWAVDSIAAITVAIKSGVVVAVNSVVGVGVGCAMQAAINKAGITKVADRDTSLIVGPLSALGWAIARTVSPVIDKLNALGGLAD